jgi:hypothetical protein
MRAATEQHEGGRKAEQDRSRAGQDGSLVLKLKIVFSLATQRPPPPTASTSGPGFGIDFRGLESAGAEVDGSAPPSG